MSRGLGNERASAQPREVQIFRLFRFLGIFYFMGPREFRYFDFF